MICTIAIKSAEEFKSFFRNNEAEYLDVFINMYSVYFIANTTASYSHRVVTVLSRDDHKGDLTLRVEKKKLLDMILEGFIEIKVSSGMVYLTFKNKKNIKVYSIEFKQSQSYLESIYDKLDLLTELKEYPMIDIEELVPMTRICKSLNTPICVRDGLAFTTMPSLNVYMKTNCTNLCVTPVEVAYLIKFTTKVYNVSNYLGYQDDNIAVLIKKCRDIEGNDYNYLAKAKYTHKIILSFSEIITLCRKCDFQDGTFVLDLDKNVARFLTERCTYSAPISIADVKTPTSIKAGTDLNMALQNIDLSDSATNVAVDLTKSVHNIPALRIPSRVLKNILTNTSGTDTVIMYISKNFIRLDIRSVVIVFSRSDYNE